MSPSPDKSRSEPHSDPTVTPQTLQGLRDELDTPGIPVPVPSAVNGTRTGRTVLENLSPNQTRFTVQRSDPISRYRFVLRARTQVGEGDPLAEESPALLDEGKGSARLCRGDRM